MNSIQRLGKRREPPDSGHRVERRLVECLLAGRFNDPQLIVAPIGVNSEADDNRSLVLPTPRLSRIAPLRLNCLSHLAFIA